jgi:5-methylcytosine-specific restriction endonuclease McrA
VRDMAKEQRKNILLKEYDVERLNQKCHICKKTFNLLEIHHIDRDRKNNRRENLIFVCKKCHSLIHMPYKKEFKYFQPRCMPRNHSEKKLAVKQFHSHLKVV